MSTEREMHTIDLYLANDQVPCQLCGGEIELVSMLSRPSVILCERDLAVAMALLDQVGTRITKGSR